MAYKSKKDQAEYVKKHYLLNKERYVARAKAFGKLAIQRNRDYVAKYLEDHCCSDCEESDPVVLEFDHVKGVKRGNISNMVKNAVSLKKLITEIAKCEVRCANCHRRKTRERMVRGKPSKRPESNDRLLF